MKTLLSLSLLLAVLPSYSQDAPSEPYQPVFARVFPQPTGRNGHEELAMAGDLVKLHGTDRLVDAGVTLTEKRKALREPAIVKALALMRAGLRKPMTPPAESASEDRFLGFAGIRSLGRLLMIEQYVLLADGKVSESIDSLRDGLRLGYAMGGQLIIGGLVGVAVDAIVIRGIANHLDQLSARDCEKLMKVTTEWLKMPDPGIAALEAERHFTLKHLNKTGLAADSALGREVASLVTARMSIVQDMLRKEPWNRGELPPLEGNSPGVVYLRNLGLFPNFDQMLEVFARDLAKVQLLGTHAGIRRFRWEHNCLPKTLDEAQLGRLAIDPFSGKPFMYGRLSDSMYTLTSVKVDRL